MMAAYEERITYIRGHKITLHSGQTVAGVDYLAERWGRNKRTVMRFLQMLEHEGMINRSVMHNSVAIITVMDEVEDDAEAAGVIGSAVHQRITCEKRSASACFGGAQQEKCTPECTPECTSDRAPECTGDNNRKSGSYEYDNNCFAYERRSESAPQLNKIRRKNNINDDNARERGVFDEDFLANVQKLYRVSGDVLADKLKAFTLHVVCRGVQHKSCEDARRHFCDWLRIQLTCESKEKRVMGHSATTSRRKRQEPSHDNGCDYSTSF